MKEGMVMSAKYFSILGSLGCLAVAGAIGCSQPAPKCTTGRGPFTVTYTAKGGAAACGDVKGEVYGLQDYNAAKADGSPDLEHASVAVQNDNLGYYADTAGSFGVEDTDKTHAWYALGAFATGEPEDDDFCRVPTLSVAEQNLPAVPAVEPDPTVPDDPGFPGQDAIHLKYEWKNLAFYVTPAALGTQFAGEVTVTTDGQACNYEAVGLYPAVSCGVPEKPDDPNSAMVPDERACNAAPDPENGYATGSGINPDFPVKCDPDLLLCVLVGRPPALK